MTEKTFKLFTKVQIKATVLYTILGFLPLLTQFALLPINTRYLSPEDYGIVSLANITQGYLTLITIFGLDNAIIRYYFDYYHSESQIKNFLSTVFISLVGMIIFTATFMLLFGSSLIPIIWGESLDFHVYGKWILMIMSCTVLNTSILLIFRNSQNLKGYAALALCAFIFQTCGALIGIVFLEKGALGNIAGKSIGLLIASLPLYLVFLYRTKLKFEYNFSLLKQMLIFSLPVFLYTIIGELSLYVDRYIINLKFSLKSIGIYSVAFIAVGATNIFVNSIWNAIYPNVLKALKNNIAVEQIKTLYRGMYGISILLFWGAVTFLEPVFSLITSESYQGIGDLIPALALLALTRTTYIIYSVNIFYYKRTKILPISVTVGLLVTSLAAYFFSSSHGLHGICFAVSLGSFSQSCVVYLFDRLFIPEAQTRLSPFYGIFIYIGHFILIASNMKFFDIYKTFDGRLQTHIIEALCVTTILLFLSRKDTVKAYHALKGRS